MSEDLYNEKELFAAIAAGNAEAFGIFFERYNRRLFIFIEGLIHSKADAEEIVQETFIKIWRSPHLLKDIDRPGQYAYAIARNKTLNYIRNASRRKQLLDEVWACQQKETDESFEQSLQAHETKTRIAEALSLLSPRKQEIFRLSRELGWNHEEIALHLHLSRSRVKNSIVETLQYLRDWLGRNGNLLFLAFYLTHSWVFPHCL